MAEGRESTISPGFQIARKILGMVTGLPWFGFNDGKKPAEARKGSRDPIQTLGQTTGRETMDPVSPDPSTSCWKADTCHLSPVSP
jgi:hypothetical protein